jgi:hypothetical protein
VHAASKPSPTGRLKRATAMPMRKPWPSRSVEYVVGLPLFAMIDRECRECVNVVNIDPVS